MKDLEQVPFEEQLEFFNSFDHVLCDMDGVIWLTYRPLPGAREALELLKKLRKSIKFVTNNDFTEPAVLAGRIQKCFGGFTEEDIAQPVSAVIDYLKNINFDRELYLVSSKIIRSEFEKAGFKLAEKPPQEVDEEMSSLIESLEDDGKVGCVVNLTDFNFTFMKLQKCLLYLKRPDCLWIVGPLDKGAPVGPKGPLLGPHFHINGLKTISEREYVCMSKPTKEFNDFFVRKFNLQDPKRVLFIGDTIDPDMKMAHVGGYKKLLVFTGMAKREEVENWSHEDELKPDYYIQGLDSMRHILEKVQKVTLANKH